MKRYIFSLIITVWAGNSFAYYQAQQGRWMSRDPIMEEGGNNLYAFISNSSINDCDFLGQRRIFLGPINVNPLTWSDGKNTWNPFSWGNPKEAKQLKSIEPGLIALCENSKCVCGEDAQKECKKEAKILAGKVRNVFLDNFGYGPYPTGGDPVGGYFCWDWSRNFHSALSALNFKHFAVEHAMNANSDGRGYVHYFVHIYAGKRDSDCELTLDDNWGGYGFVHDSMVPPASTGGTWGPPYTAPYYWHSIPMRRQ